MNDQPLAYPIDKAARISGIGRTKLYEAIRDGKLVARKFGRRTVISAEALRAFLEALPKAPAKML